MPLGASQVETVVPRDAGSHHVASSNKRQSILVYSRLFAGFRKFRKTRPKKVFSRFLGVTEGRENGNYCIIDVRSSMLLTQVRLSVLARMRSGKRGISC